jgi:predicted negative regulator of RcsB-dependent stress response
MKKLFKFLLALAAVAVIGYFGYNYFTNDVVEAPVEAVDTPAPVVDSLAVDTLNVEAVETPAQDAQ